MKKTVLITGTSSGFGKTAAKHFAGNGWNVIATMRNPAAEKDLVDSDDVLVTRLDVQDRASIDQAIAAGIARFGKIDALVNNAGFGLFGLLESFPREKIQEQFDVNVFGVIDVTRAILPHFRKNRGGVILNISSGAGVFTLPMLSMYCASKFALEGFSEALSYELASQNIVVKIIEPGGVTSTNFGKRSGAEFIHDASSGTMTPSSPAPTPSSTACAQRGWRASKTSLRSSSRPPLTGRASYVMWPPRISCLSSRPGERPPRRATSGSCGRRSCRRREHRRRSPRSAQEETPSHRRRAWTRARRDLSTS